MAQKADEVVSVRLPRGVANEIRQLAQVPLSTLARTLLVTFLNNERRKALQKESPPDEQQ